MTMNMKSSRTSPLLTVVVVVFYYLVVPVLPLSSTAFVVPPASILSTSMDRLSSVSSSQHAVVPSPLRVVDFVTLAVDDATASISSSTIPYHDYSSSLVSASSSSSSSDILLSLATLDPTTLLSDVLGGLLGSSAILAVPIVAALTIVAVIAALIVGYANPADED